MFAATDAACELLSEMLGQAEVPVDVAARFVIEDQKLSLKLDKERPGDSTFDHAGRTVLLVDQMVTDLLTGKTLDVQDSEGGPQLTLL